MTMTSSFTLLQRIGGSSANHILQDDELVQLAKEAALLPCVIIGGYREGDQEDQIEIIIRYKHRRKTERPLFGLFKKEEK
jgi:hypothetical protein